MHGEVNSSAVMTAQKKRITLPDGIKSGAISMSSTLSYSRVRREKKDAGEYLSSLAIGNGGINTKSIRSREGASPPPPLELYMFNAHENVN